MLSLGDMLALVRFAPGATRACALSHKAKPMDMKVFHQIETKF
jgi:hypothetical protein